MTRTSGGELILLDQEIEKTLKKQRKEKNNKMEQEQQTQTNSMALSSYATPTLDGTTSSIRRPNVQANNFKIKSVIIQMIR